MPAGITLSEDEIGAVNPDMFHDFFLPELVELSDRYGGFGMHCCANARHQWPAWKQIPNMRLLNVAQPPTETQDAYSVFADHTAQMHGWCGDGDPQTWRFPEASHAVISTGASSRDEAQRLVASLRVSQCQIR
jgi:hypothetical protein